MKTIDRVILAAIALGLWGQLAVTIFGASPSMALDESDVESIVKDVVEDCAVRGKVYIYDMPDGEITGGRIDC